MIENGNINDEFDIDDIDDSDIDELISNMHPDLILSNIYDQIDYIFESKNMNFLDIYLDKYKYIKNLLIHQEDNDRLEELKQYRDDVLNSIINKICKKFKFSIHVNESEVASRKQLKHLARALYMFFIFNYNDNLKKYYLKLILRNKKVIADEVKRRKPKIKDVTTSTVKQFYGQKEAFILTGINYIIFDLSSSFPYRREEFINLIAKDESGFVYEFITSLFNGETIFDVEYDKDIYDTFTKPLLNKEPGHSTIISDITVQLFSIFGNKKVTDFNIIEEEN